GKRIGERILLKANARLNQTTVEQGQEVVAPEIPQLPLMRKIVVFLGDNGENVKDLLIIEKWLEKNPSLKIYTVPKSIRVGTALSFKDIDNILDHKKLSQL